MSYRGDMRLILESMSAAVITEASTLASLGISPDNINAIHSKLKSLKHNLHWVPLTRKRDVKEFLDNDGYVVSIAADGSVGIAYYNRTSGGWNYAYKEEYVGAIVQNGQVTDTKTGALGSVMRFLPKDN